MSEDKTRSRDVILCLIFAVYIGLFIYLGMYAIPCGDDYGSMWGIEHNGAMRQVIDLYNGTAKGFPGVPRVTSVAVTSVLLSLFSLEGLYWVYPLFTALTYLMAVYFLVSSVFPSITFRKKILSVLTVSAITLAIHCELSGLLYEISVEHYFWSTSLMLLSLALSVKSLTRGGVLLFLLTTAVVFFTGLSLETTVIFQGAFAFFATLYFLLITQDKPKAVKAGTFWIVSIIAFLIMYLSPGVMHHRLIKMAFIPHIIRAFAVTVAFGFFTAVKFFVKPVVYVFLLFIPDILIRSKLNVKGWHIVLTVIFVAALNQFIGGWATGSGLEFRGESLALWMMGLVWVFMWSFCYGGKLSEKTKLYPFRWMLLVISLLISSNFIRGVQDISIVKDYRGEHENMLRLTQEQVSAGELDVYVPISEVSPKILKQARWRPSPHVGYSNVEYSMYYGLKSLTALPEAMLEDKAIMSRWKQGNISDFLKLAEVNELYSLIAGEIYDPHFAGIDGVPSDNEKAIYWYTKAADMGNIQACRRLTRLYVLYDKSSGHYIKAGMWFVRSELPLIRP